MSRVFTERQLGEGAAPAVEVAPRQKVAEKR
jgi:hypothetical protein